MAASSDDPRAELAARFDVDERDRYETGRALGRGGMGEVRAAQDARLDREVALKVLHRADVGAEARLAREASLAARLEHPGIVPVYNAGRLPDGRAYYAMRVIRGRSLAEILRTTPALADRLRLMRQVLDACEAVAYAHDQGVLHRDLKPANVMVGEHGETAVVDWGLAIELNPPPAAAPVARLTRHPAEQTWDGEGSSEADDEPVDDTPREAREPTERSGTGELTQPGQIIGTPAYMPPEQARGEPLDRRADVFALGGILYAVLSGGAPRESDDPFAPIPPLAARCPEAPPELVAIATRAMALDADDRYADAGALATDLDAWFDGRRVAAFDYSVWQHLRRVYAAWRVPLLVGAGALVALAVAVGVGWWRTTIERNRAIEAEQSAHAAQQASDRSLAAALVAQARVAADQGERAQAEVLAAHRLRYGESPEARGILARFGGQSRPQLRARHPMPFCQSVAADRDASRLACLQDDKVLLLRATDGAILSELAARPYDAAFSSDGDLLFVSTFDQGVLGWDLASSRSQPLDNTPHEVQLQPSTEPDTVLLSHSSLSFALHHSDGHQTLLTRCPKGTVGQRMILDLGGDTFAQLCSTPTLDTYTLYSQSGGVSTPLYTLSRKEGLPVAFATDLAGTIATGFDTGLIVIYGSDTRRVLRVQTDLAGISSLGFGQGLLAASGARGGVLALDPHTGTVLARLPAADGAGVRWTNEAGRLRIFGAGVQEWEVPALPSPHRYEHDSGIAAVGISADGRRIASAHGFGSVYVYDRVTGTPLLVENGSGGTGKDVSFSPDGARLAVAVGSPNLSKVYWLDEGGRSTAPALPGLRRVEYVGGELFVAPYKSGLLSMRDPNAEAPDQAWPMPEEVGDMEAFSDGLGLVAVDQTGRLFRVDLDAPGRHLAPVGEAPAARAIAASRASIWQVLPRSVVQLDATGTEIRRAPVPASAPTTEIAVSPGDRWVAVGLFDGTVVVLDGANLQLRAVLRGHEARVGSAAFDASGRWLVTGGWDGAMLVWDMSVLDEDADALIAPIEAAWGLSLEQVLGAHELSRIEPDPEEARDPPP